MFVEGKPWIVFFLQTLYFMAFIETVEKIITYALGEHDPGSAPVWRTSNDFCSPGLFIDWFWRVFFHNCYGAGQLAITGPWREEGDDFVVVCLFVY